MDQQPQTAPPHPSEQGEELDLIELWNALIEHKLLIIVFTALTTFGSIYYASNLPDIYRTEVFLVPISNNLSSSPMVGGGGLSRIFGQSSIGIEGERAIVQLKTKIFLTNYIKEKNLKPILFSNQWNGQGKLWIDKEPSDREAFELLFDMISIDIDPKNPAKLIILSLEWKDPGSLNKIADIANGIVESINIYAKNYVILESRESILFLEKELEKTDVVSLKNILYNLIEQQIQRIMIANIKSDFIFKVIDPAIQPEFPSNKRVISIILFEFVIGLFAGLVFIYLKFVVLKKIRFTGQGKLV